MNIKKSNTVKDAANKLYQQARELGIDVLLDDRDERPGIKFADMELIGIPHQIIIGENSLREGKVEYQARSGGGKKELILEKALDELKNFLA